jgi:polyisoprenoid-binding protein YceI
MLTRRSALLTAVLAAPLLSGTLGLAGAFSPAPAAPDVFAIDPVHSTAIFRVHHMGAGRFYGRFNDVVGMFTFSEESDEMPSFDVTIKTESVDTKTEALDTHLKSADFFAAKEHPDMTFKSRTARKSAARTYEVTGDLTIRGVTKPVAATLEWTGANDGGPRFGYRCGFETSFTIKRSDFGMSYGLENKALGDETLIIVSLEGRRQ